MGMPSVPGRSSSDKPANVIAKLPKRACNITADKGAVKISKKSDNSGMPRPPEPIKSINIQITNFTHFLLFDVVDVAVLVVVVVDKVLIMLRMSVTNASMFNVGFESVVGDDGDDGITDVDTSVAAKTSAALNVRSTTKLAHGDLF